MECPICGTAEIERRDVGTGAAIEYRCRRCGRYELTRTAEAVLAAADPGARKEANASAWLREHEGVRLRDEDLKELWAIRAPPVAERAMKVLQEIAKRWPNIGSMFDFEFPDLEDPSWLAVSWSEHSMEVSFLVTDYLHRTMEAISGIVTVISAENRILKGGQITPRGHQLLQELREGNPDSPIGFCAMWFKPEFLPLWTDAIEPAIRAAGYDPKRIDQHEHTNRIDDEIVAMIRRSRFVVADFTGQRGGVYFEAGYALGLGLRVIWTCREDHLNEVHFDTRQYNFLVWKQGEYDDLAKRLQDRIEATLGRGPIKG
ncbi:MAG: hypothetical protein ACHBNF_05530 [Chromatiales bacterium]